MAQRRRGGASGNPIDSIEPRPTTVRVNTGDSALPTELLAQFGATVKELGWRVEELEGAIQASDVDEALSQAAVLRGLTRELSTLVESLGALELARLAEVEAAQLPEIEQLAGARVLVVDDERLNRRLLTSTLTKLGYEVAEAADGVEALAKVEREGFDVVLLDLVLPKLEGLALLELIRRRRSSAELPVIVTSGLGDGKQVLESLRRGANDYVTKPLDFGLVAARVEVHLKLKRSREVLARLRLGPSASG